MKHIKTYETQTFFRDLNEIKTYVVINERNEYLFIMKYISSNKDSFTGRQLYFCRIDADLTKIEYQRNTTIKSFNHELKIDFQSYDIQECIDYVETFKSAKKYNI